MIFYLRFRLDYIYKAVTLLIYFANFLLIKGAQLFFERHSDYGIHGFIAGGGKL